MKKSTANHSLHFETLESRLPFSASPLSVGTELVASAAKGSVKLPYTYSVRGNTADVAVNLPIASSGLALAGGGVDVDEVFNWMGSRASGGDFLVLRATGTDAYNTYIDGLVPSLDSVATLIIPDRAAAMNSAVAAIINGAEAIFLAGGDQANYVNFWNDTPVETAIYNAVLRNSPIGGTSAGLAVLGDVDFSATLDTITSAEALSNPRDNRIVSALDSRFLSPNDSVVSGLSSTVLRYMDNVITDSHFMQRDRMGRLLTFMAYSDAENLVDGQPRGIGVNEQTALLINFDGVTRIVGNAYTNKKLTATEEQRSAYIVRGNTVMPTVPAGVPLSYSATVARANYDPEALGGPRGDVFDLDVLFGSTSWTVPGLDTYDVFAANGAVTLLGYSDLIYGEMPAKRRARLA
jgi:cyanophycinase